MHFLSGRSPRTLLHRLSIRLAGAALAAAPVLLFGTSAHAQIKEPGNHPDYSVELEPHGVFDWGFGPDWAGDGFGVGARATIPIIQDGPIKTINNSMGIGFGLDWIHYSYGCGDFGVLFRAGYPGGHDCAANSLLFPVVMQWNFWLTKVISVFGEPGLAIEHHWSDSYTYTASLACGPDHLCPYTVSGTTVQPVFAAGARFMFGHSVGLTVRLGIPYLSVGASFLF